MSDTEKNEALVAAEKERREIIERLQKADVNVSGYGQTDDDEDAIKTQPIALLSMRGLRRVDEIVREQQAAADERDRGDVPGEF